MSMTRFASASLLALGLLTGVTACGDGGNSSISGDLKPFRSDWEQVARWPFDVSSVSTLTVGGSLDGDNFANRGNVEVFYSLDTAEIVVQMRKFTFAAELEGAGGAQEDFDKMSPWMNVGSKVNPNGDSYSPEALCTFTDPESGAESWQDNCGIHIYYDGQTQKLRVGADIRVFLPKNWEGTLNVVTEDNLAEAEEYPDRGDVTILDLAGSADITVDSARVNVRLSPNVEPVPACSEAQNQACADVGWDTNNEACTACQDFGRVRVTTRGQLPIQGTLDAPSDLWMNVTMLTALPGPMSEAACESTIRCEDFDSDCNWIDNDANKPFDRRAELNKPASSLEGLGYNVNFESGACVVTNAVEGPEDFGMPGSSLRGELVNCSGCITDTIPDI